MITMPAPVGVSAKHDISIPLMTENADTTAEQMITCLKLLQSLIDVSEGNIIKLDIKSAPMSCIPITTVTAVSTAIADL